MKYWKLLLAAVLLAGLLLGCAPAADSLTVTIPSIGKADCSILIQGDQVMVIDCGEAENSGEILQTLKGLGVTKIDCLVITHFDKDHVGGAADILNTLPVSQVLEPDYTPENPQSGSYLAYRQALTDTKVPCLQVADSKTFSLGTASVTVTGAGGKTYDKNVDNNNSLQVSVTHGGNRLLFAGDIEKQRIRDLLDTGIAQYDFLKVPHHGVYNNALPDFFRAVGMEYAVITCSNKNPAETKTLEVLEALSAKTYLTSNGEITVSSTPSGIQIRQ